MGEDWEADPGTADPPTNLLDPTEAVWYPCTGSGIKHLCTDR